MWTEYHDLTDNGESIELCYTDDLFIELRLFDREDRESTLELSGDEAVGLATGLLQCASHWRTVQEAIALAKTKAKGEMIWL